MHREMTEIDIVKFFSGNCTELEKKEIENWRKISDRNQRLFDEYRAVWENTVPDMPDFNVEAGLEKVYQKLSEDRSNEKSIAVLHKGRSRTLRYIIGVAASIILVLGVYFGYKSITSGGVDYMTVTTVSKEVIELKLDDGTIVWVNSHTTINYPEKFAGKERKVRLKGEAFFKVTKNPDKPFIIETGSTIIEVLGTSFNVRAVEGEENEIVSVSEGLVSVTSAKDEEVNTKIASGEQCKLDKGTSEIQKAAIDDVNYDSWKTRKLIFESTSMKDVVNTLSNYFETSIIVEDEVIGEMQLTSTFSDPELDDVLKVIELTDEVKISQSGDYIILKKK